MIHWLWEKSMSLVEIWNVEHASDGNTKTSRSRILKLKWGQTLGFRSFLGSLGRSLGKNYLNNWLKRLMATSLRKSSQNFCSLYCPWLDVTFRIRTARRPYRRDARRFSAYNSDTGSGAIRGSPIGQLSRKRVGPVAPEDDGKTENVRVARAMAAVRDFAAWPRQSARRGSMRARVASVCVCASTTYRARRLRRPGGEEKKKRDEKNAKNKTGLPVLAAG